MSDDPEITCAYGTPFPHRFCVGCLKSTLKHLRDFEAAVQAGTYDRQGYTPAERKAKDRQERMRIHEP